MTHDSPWFTREQAAKYLQISLPTLSRLLRDGALPVYRNGRVVRINRDDIDTYLRGNPKEPSLAV